MKSPSELAELFRARGLKLTPQRQAVFEALARDGAHPTAESVHSAVRATMPSVSLRTVYATLHDLADMGEILQIDLGTGAQRFDPNLEPHHHLVCDSCGTVLDVHGDFADVAVPDEELRGFEMSSTEIIFRGVCQRCRQPTSPRQQGEQEEWQSYREPRPTRT